MRFTTLVWNYYKTHGRHDLPWRKTTNPYRILISEVMLQQTQVERVIPFYKAWLTKFPTVQVLAKAPLADVLRAWQGLGYNRRAKMLHEAAKEIVRSHKGVFPKTAEALQKLPGIGPYTAQAVAAFAYNHDGILLETNTRTVVMHHFFPKRKSISDTAIAKILAKELPKGKAREWYAALMDYGTHLKRSGVRINAKSKTYTKQSTFKGSSREARGAVLKELAKGSATLTRLAGLLGDNRKDQVRTQIENLEKEGLIQKRGSAYTLPR